MTLQFADMMSLSIFFEVVLLNLVIGPSFLVNIINGSGVMPIYFHKGLTRNMELFMKCY